MSVVTLLFGQCGIQIGQDLFTTLHDDINTKPSEFHPSNKEYVAAARKRWFRVNKRGVWLPRSILIDTDHKTVPTENKYKNVLSKPLGGCGNNWAFGYCSRSTQFVNEIEEILRKQFENEDDVSNILSVFSSGGGTGSGVGTRAVEHIRDFFPEKTMISALVLPFNAGEIIVQSYNTLLTVSKLYDSTDALLLFENDKLHACCRKSQTYNVNLDHLNSLISDQLGLALQPVKDLHLRDLIKCLIPQTAHKFVQLYSASVTKEENSIGENAFSWSVLMKEIARTNRYQSQSTPRSLTNVLISRGTSEPAEPEVMLVAKKIAQHYHQHRQFKNKIQSAVLLSNNSSVRCTLNTLLDDAWKLFTHGAYLHHYSKYGVEEPYFLSAFERLETILYDYKNL